MVSTPIFWGSKKTIKLFLEWSDVFQKFSMQISAAITEKYLSIYGLVNIPDHAKIYNFYLHPCFQGQ